MHVFSDSNLFLDPRAISPAPEHVTLGKTPRHILHVLKQLVSWTQDAGERLLVDKIPQSISKPPANGKANFKSEARGIVNFSGAWRLGLW